MPGHDADILDLRTEEDEWNGNERANFSCSQIWAAIWSLVFYLGSDDVTLRSLRPESAIIGILEKDST